MEYVNDEETGEVKEVAKTKTVTVSNTDPECGLFHKGEKQKCFAYAHQTFCDKNGFVLTVKTAPGNLHDSVVFFDAYRELNEKFTGLIQNVSLDSAYKIAPICREIAMNGQKAFMPYTRQKGKNGYMKKYEFVYDGENDIYICPNDKTLYFTTINKEGYRVYKCEPKDCAGCPFKAQCTKSKAKTLTRHIWEDFVDQVNELRYTEEWKEIYPLRKQSIERVFADCKEKFGMRFTRLIGLKKNQHLALMSFACHNLKRMSLWGW